MRLNLYVTFTMALLAASSSAINLELGADQKMCEASPNTKKTVAMASEMGDLKESV